MRIDLISIFCDYFEPLRLSLLGRAQANGVLEIRCHDLRRWTDDTHRTVDDAPYGGGPGMLMRPEPWGRALDDLAPAESPSRGAPAPHDGDDSPAEPTAAPLLVLPTPSGRRFTQADAADWAARPWIVIGCGRYEGIDARVAEDAARRMPVEQVSIGDYVLAGGEAAALVIVEAVARLLPGVMGNESSAVEESFSDPAMLEGPAYTRPPSWRGLDVPQVLLSGDHAAIAAWRAELARERTARQRPDLLAP